MTHPPIAEQDAAAKIVKWASSHRKTLTGIAVLIVVIASGIWFWYTARQRREAFAQNALAEARAAAASGNLALAGSDLSRLVGTYSGTTASGEATILLAQIRLLEDQAPLAVTELRQFLASGPADQFVGPAHGLLAVALEETGSPDQAAEEYLRAAETSWYDAVQAQFLIEAARTLTAAGDTTRAIATYQRVLDEFGETGTDVEARVRLAELLRSTPMSSD